MKIFITGFLQVYFVAINTVLLAKGHYLGVFFAAFMISMLWSGNVKKVAFGGIKDRFIYSIGASIGSILGLLTTKIII